MRNKKISISISIFLTIVIFSIFILHQRSNTNNGELESFGVNENNIIAKISNDNTVDIFTRDGSNLLFIFLKYLQKIKFPKKKYSSEQNIYLIIMQERELSRLKSQIQLIL
jgi:hypothetical protein